MGLAALPSIKNPLTRRKPTGPSNEDNALLNELFETIEKRPPAIEARVVLVQTLIRLGEEDSASEANTEILKLDPNHKEAKALALSLPKLEEKKKDEPKKAAIFSPSSSSAIQAPKTSDKANGLVTPPKQTSTTHQKQAGRDLKSLIDSAKVISRDMRLLQIALRHDKNAASLDKAIADLATIADKRPPRTSDLYRPPKARLVAKEMQKDVERAVDIAFADLEEMTLALRKLAAEHDKDELDNDDLREVLARRTASLAAALPASPSALNILPHTALMHLEHELLGREYALAETMLGDAVADIPRANFWVSEDNYPWDMDELRQAITANGGVMRNPMSKELFTVADVRAILSHPLGRDLAALAVEQGQLSQGVRTETIDKIDAMATVLLKDNSEDQIPSRHAVDEFQVYFQTLPEAEKKAVSKLRVPAKDSHTGRAYDTTILKTINDAYANRICFHKTGDFLRQAAAHLRKNQSSSSRFGSAFSFLNFF